MNEAASAKLTVGEGADARDIAILTREGKAPALFWLGGFRSDMAGAKATAIDQYGAKHGLATLRFDYSGHGQSGGRFEDGTISRWLEEARAVLARLGTERVIVIGSSMGGWIALRLAEMLRDRGQVAGLILIAPAFDMTRALMWDTWSKTARKAMMASGVYMRPSEYGDEPYPVTLKLIEDGDRHTFGERLIDVGCPVHILQGMKDKDVPFRHAEKLVTRLASDDVMLTLIKDGDHRLSRPEDLLRLEAALDGILTEAGYPPQAA